jgi:hypothetical protein
MPTASAALKSVVALLLALEQIVTKSLAHVKSFVPSGLKKLTRSTFSLLSVIHGIVCRTAVESNVFLSRFRDVDDR